MNRPAPHERPTAAQLRDGSENPMSIAGRPADVCPGCGGAMFATGTRQGEQDTFRYVECRNQSCLRRFYSRQPPAIIIREIGDNTD